MSNSSEDDNKLRLIGENRSNMHANLRGNKIRTYLVSIPADTKPPKVNKHGSIREITAKDTVEEVEKHIDDIENIVQNIQVINVACSNCIGSCKNIINLKAKIKDNNVKASVV